MFSVVNAVMHRVNAGFLAMIGVSPERGRDFLPKENQPGAPRVAIISRSLWQRCFGGDPSLVGRTILLDGTAHTVVGILPAGFELYGSDIDVYTPIAPSTARAPGMPGIGVHAHLKPGVSVERAQSEIHGLCPGWVQPEIARISRQCTLLRGTFLTCQVSGRQPPVPPLPPFSQVFDSLMIFSAASSACPAPPRRMHGSCSVPARPG